MNTSLIALALGAGLAAAVPAAANGSMAQYGGSQYHSGPGAGPNFSPAGPGRVKLDPTRDTPESMQAYGKLLAYGECLLATGQSADNILTSKPYSRAERDRTGLLRQRVKTCPAKGFDNIHSLVRGSLAEAMYRRQVKQLPVVDAAKAKAFVDGEKAFQSDRDKGDQVMAGVVSCMVAAAPDKAHGILSTQHGTGEESTAMDAFFAASAKCGAGASRPKNLSRSYIRAFVADSAWRYARMVR